jgi:hypothetical protein
MAINATNQSKPRELIPAGNYAARCYQMIHIGTITETIKGESKIMNKVRIGWELPTETRVFKEENGEQPFVTSKEFTLSMNEKSNLRKLLESWRGKPFTKEQAESFDITALLNVPCMLNIIHKVSEKTGNTYEEIASVTPMPKGFVCPPQVNPTFKWEYDNPDWMFFELLPQFIREKIESSKEYKSLEAKAVAAQKEPAAQPIPPMNPGASEFDNFMQSAQEDKLPF